MAGSGIALGGPPKMTFLLHCLPLPLWTKCPMWRTTAGNLWTTLQCSRKKAVESMQNKEQTEQSFFWNKTILLLFQMWNSDNISQKLKIKLEVGISHR